MSEDTQKPTEQRATMDVDIACVGFGPAAGGFLTTLARKLVNPDGTPAVESKVAPGMPPQVVCYERADDIGFGVSGVVTRARGIRASFPELNPAEIPMAAPVTTEKVVYLLDPTGASRRSIPLRIADKLALAFRWLLPYEHHAIELPYTPAFLHKKDGLVMSIGQFNHWVGSQLMATGAVQIWPGTPVSEALIEGEKVVGIRLVDQGVDRHGLPETSFTPGMDIRAALTVVADGPVGQVGRQIDTRFGLPMGHHQREWAVGMKFVVDLPQGVDLAPGTVIHTFGFPEPEIFGFFYVHPDHVASVGIFVPSWFDSPARTSYRYLQHFIQHPYLWRYLEGGSLRSWGAKSLQESGKRGEPHLVGDGYARIGECSGSTNVLTGSGVDEAWTTGTQLAEGVAELLIAGQPLTRDNLANAYEKRRRESWIEKDGRIAERARDGFQQGVISGLIGMAVAGLTRGLFSVGSEPVPPHSRIRSIEKFYRRKLGRDDIKLIRTYSGPATLHDRLMDACGWPPIEHDGHLLVSHQDALLMGGKVQAPAGYADHVHFVDPYRCRSCAERVCVEICSGQAITAGEDGLPNFDREKCVFCGACVWNCSQSADGEHGNIEFAAGAGGLHSAQN
jgi:electron-transferring-flavoprotein dehydrogenase